MEKRSDHSTLSENDITGPLVVHFENEDTTPSKKYHSSLMGRRLNNAANRKNGSCCLWTIGSLTVLVIIFVLSEIQHVARSPIQPNTSQKKVGIFEIDNAPPDGAGQTLSTSLLTSSSSSSTQNTGSIEQQRQKIKSKIKANNEDAMMEEAAKNAFLFWGHHAERLSEQQQIELERREMKRKKRKRQKLKAIPIIENNDDSLPQAVGGAVIRAADALMCRDSVIDYVINATDLKDECDGLKKAFDKTCTAEASAELAASRRRLTEMNNDPIQKQKLLLQMQQSRRNNNPVVTWQYTLYRFELSIRQFLFSSKPAIFSAEDEVLQFWEEAEYQVQNDYDYLIRQEFEQQLQKEELLQDEHDDEKEEAAADYGDNENEQHRQMTEYDADNVPMPAKNKTVVPNKPKMSLSLPTASQHVSDKVLTETLLLQNEGELVASAIRASQNNTAAGTPSSTAPVSTTTNLTAIKEANKAEAAASSKAVADTVDLVTAVLNDPTIVEARTCCASILGVFHDNCSVDESEEFSDSHLFIVVFVIALCGLIKSLIRHFQIRWLPEAAGCILVGVGSGWMLTYFPHQDISFDEHWFLRILVPPIVFEAALSIDKRSFNRHVIPILIYAVVGTLLATGLTAVIVHKGSSYLGSLCETIPVIESLTFGALISSIDPIAVLSVLSNMGMTDTDTIYVLIFGESLLNDGVAIVLFQTLVHFLDEEMHVDSQAIAAASIHFLVVAVGSLLVGVASGLCCTVYYWTMHGCQTPLVEVLMFFCWALIPYYVCDGIEWSGIVAAVATGFVMDLNVVGQSSRSEDDSESDGSDHHPLSSTPTTTTTSTPTGRERRRRPIFFREGHLSAEAKRHIGFVTEILATLMETAIFAYLGLFLFSSRYHWNKYHTIIAILACCVSRAIMIPTLSFVANWATKTRQFRAQCQPTITTTTTSSSSSTTTNNNNNNTSSNSGRRGHRENAAGVIIDKNMQLVLWFAGLRGAMSFALVENIPPYDALTGEGTRHKAELKAMTSASIMFTVFVLGGCTFYMMEHLGLSPSSHSSGHHKQSSSLPELDIELMGLLSSRSSIDEKESPNHNKIQQQQQQQPSSSSVMTNNDSPFRATRSANRPKNTFRQRMNASSDTAM